MNIYPKLYLNNVKEITLELLQKNNIKALVLDLDNTIIDYNKKTIDGLEDWCNNLKNNNIKFFILSNSNKKEKVKTIANLLEVPYIYFAKKPLKRGYYKVQKLLNIEFEQIAVVGDQIFTDIIGANKCKMFSILVKPLDKKDIWITIIKRPLENFIIKKYLKKGEN